ncbi:fructose-6-phosphate aldolase [Clostridium felsineum]|uniref:Probable transaldolase n=1 Tax=Clostridium felsineum TaxID=36839 RepID=A0A1S8MCF3_9CLOT|nr:fructose-6-phosphate aldolase [Clostridium felsineum]URZ04970.1 Transaldolase [Clostridium felsineum]URZ10011.1 Transaldolase [Clostridium felsineum]
MKIFIDTANVEEIKAASKLGVLSGVTTNPSLIAKEGRDLKEVIEEICSIVNGPISAEVISLEAYKMIAEARELAKLHENIVIKVPMCADGLEAVNVLSKEGIKTNVTLIFSPLQALLAARAGASFVSPFLGRLDDIGNPGIEVVRQIVDIFEIHNIKTEVISASVRNPMHVLDVAMAGSHIATIPYGVIIQMTKHTLTDQGIEKFLKDYDKAFGDKK